MKPHEHRAASCFDLGDVHSGVLELRLPPGGASAVRRSAPGPSIDPPTRGQGAVGHARQRCAGAGLDNRAAPRELADVEIVQARVPRDQGISDKAAAGHYDLVIYDQCQPEDMPQANTLFIGRVAAWLEPGRRGENVAAPQIIDVDTAHPLMQLIDLGDVKFAEADAARSRRRAARC